MILCLGTTPTVQRTQVFERFSIDMVNRARSTEVTASGKSLNVARVLHTLGEQVVATGFLGGDTGRFIRQDLDRSGIAHDFVEVSPLTRTCTTIIDQSSGKVTELVEESRQVEADAWERLRAKVDSLLAGARLLVLSGSLTPGAPQEFYAWCTQRANERPVAVILDAAGEPLAQALAARPFLVKPNRAELARTLGVPTDSEEALKSAVIKLIAAGPKWAATTMGGEGSVISDGTRFWRIVTPQIKVVSPIGSGDAYAAGLAAALVRDQELPEAARLGAACAAANTMIPIAGHLRRGDVETLLPQIVLEQW
jgi:tagatose 6-phosphate kinase